MMGGLLADVRQQLEKMKLYLPSYIIDEAFFKRSDKYERDQVARLQQALTQVRQRQTEAERNEIRALCKSAEALFASNQVFDALLESLRATQKLKQISGEDNDQQIKAQVTRALRQAIYSAIEYNRLQGINITKLPAITQGLLTQSEAAQFYQPIV